MGQLPGALLDKEKEEDSLREERGAAGVVDPRGDEHAVRCVHPADEDVRDDSHVLTVTDSGHALKTSHHLNNDNKFKDTVQMRKFCS